MINISDNINHKMHIKIVGFKIHIDVEFIFKNNEMTLLKGTSGAGKSTILQAIFWALYGNMRSIYNNSRITKNLSVTLSLPGITIFRKKNPELLTVTLDDKVYHDDIAQSIIDNKYGNRDLWKSCSYIEQKSRCALLSGSGAERLELLNALSFTGDNPKEYISKISEKLKEVTSNFERSQASFVTELNIYTEGMKEKPVKHLLKEEEILILRNEILKLEEDIKFQHENVLEQERFLGTYNYILNNYQNLVNKLEDLKNKLEEKKRKNIQPVKSVKSIESIESVKPIELEKEEDIEIPKDLYIPNTPLESYKTTFLFQEYLTNKNNLVSQMNKLYEIIAKKERLEKEINEMNINELSINELSNINQDNQEEQITEEDIWKAKKLESEREKYIQECKSIGLEYDEEKIRSTLSQLTEQLSMFTKLEKHVSNYTKLLSIEDKMKTFEKGNVDELDKLSREKSLLISDLKKGLELLPCPSCKAPLRYRNGSLSLGERDPVSHLEIQKVEKEYNDILLKITNLRTLNTLEENAELLRKSIDVNFSDLQEFMKSKNKINTLSSFISKISNIKYIPEVNSERLLHIYNFQKWMAKKKELEELQDLEELTNGNNVYNGNDIKIIKQKLQDLEDSYNLEQKRIKEYQDKVKEYQKLESERLSKIRNYELEKSKIKERNQRKIDEHKKKIDEYNRNKLELEKIEEENLKKYKLELEKNEQEKRNIENEIIMVTYDLKNLEKEKKEIEQKIDTKCKEKYEKTKKNLQDKKEILEEALYALKVVDKGKELEEKRNNLLCLQKDVQTLNKLKLKAVEVEYKQLEDTVNNINTVLKTTLPIFFNEPISMSLLLFKKVKNDIKPCLNLEICYKGFKYDNINCLSGGEGDRISLALLLALNFVSNSPIILLDECVSSLDGDLKESCITAIKSIPNKTVVCIDHDDTIEGYYDSVIEIS